MSRTHDHCLNCGASLAGEFCHACGQRAGRADLRFSELAGELAEELFNWDSRLWRTLVPLMLRPGFLTAEYMAGRRARYVPPLRLYLIISFGLFLWISLWSPDVITVDVSGTPAQQATRDDPGQAKPGQPEEDIDITLIVDERFDTPWVKALEHRLETNLERLRKEPEAFVARALDYLPQMMFLLLPLFAALIRLAYLLSPYHYLQHLVFSLHYHSFAFLLYPLGSLIEGLTVHADGLLFFALLVYLPLGLRRAYGSTWKGAIWKSLLIQLIYTLMLAAAFGLAFVVALAIS